MKTTVIWVIRHLLIPAGFVWTTGIFSTLHEAQGLKNLNGGGNFSTAEIATLEITPGNAIAYGDSILKLRQKNIREAGIYTPYDYFHDLKQFEMFNQKYYDSLLKTPEGVHFLTFVVSGSGISLKGNLVNLRDENWRDLDYCYPGVGLSNTRINLDDAIEKARLYWYPKKTHSPENTHTGNFWDNFLYPILNWLLSIYLKGLLIAATLFYLWKIHLKREIDYEFYSEHLKPKISGRFEILSFLISVLIWPIILIIDIKKRFSENFRKAEVLTYRANVFTLFSKTEMRILETGKHMSFSEFRTYVQSFGMVRRYSFGFALVIVLILSLIPKPVHAKSISLYSNIYEKVFVTDYDYGEADIGYVYFQVIENEPVSVVTSTLEMVNYFFRYIDEILSGFYPDIGVIPKLIYRSKNDSLIKTITQ